MELLSRMRLTNESGQTSMKCCHAFAMLFVWVLYETQQLTLEPMQHSSPNTKESHGQSG